ncbi:MAG: DUF4386 domain-containing protein [Candidatus Thorarchaeota archaeon]|nr:DUF4386 domain-containing protein [Candidatus Thorarchaeota archaeon]
MNLDKNIPKLLGFAYLVQFIASLLSDPLRSAAIGTGNMSENLVSIADNVLLLRFNIIIDLVTALGIIVMTVLLYVVLQKENKIIALVALSFWLIEAVFLVVSSIGTNALIPLGLEYVQVGAPDPSYLLTLGTLFSGIHEFSYAIHILFFGLGGPLWYYLFYRTKQIPRYLSLWGLVLIALMPIDVLLYLLGFGFEFIGRIIVLLPLIAYLPFEGVMGLWFIFKGLDATDSTITGE